MKTAIAALQARLTHAERQLASAARQARQWRDVLAGREPAEQYGSRMADVPRFEQQALQSFRKHVPIVRELRHAIRILRSQ